MLPLNQTYNCIVQSWRVSLVVATHGLFKSLSFLTQYRYKVMRSLIFANVANSSIWLNNNFWVLLKLGSSKNVISTKNFCEYFRGVNLFKVEHIPAEVYVWLYKKKAKFVLGSCNKYRVSGNRIDKTKWTKKQTLQGVYK